MDDKQYRVFRGSNTNQLHYAGTPADNNAFYWEPKDYEGDILWSEAYMSPIDAQEAAEEYCQNREGTEEQKP